MLRPRHRQGVRQGARTLQWVGGEPTIRLPAILAAMADVPALPPVVWKSDFFGTPAAFAPLQGVVDIHLADFKFGNDACPRRIAGVECYTEVVTRNLSAPTTRLFFIGFRPARTTTP
jgi:putative pyruvate formate lyase activating enzyme